MILLLLLLYIYNIYIYIIYILLYYFIAYVLRLRSPYSDPAQTEHVLVGYYYFANVSYLILSYVH